MRRVQMDLAENQHEALNRLAVQRGLNMAEVARQAINLGLKALEQEAEFTRRASTLQAADDLRKRISRRRGRFLETDVAEDLNRIREERLDQTMDRRPAPGPRHPAVGSNLGPGGGGNVKVQVFKMTDLRKRPV